MVARIRTGKSIIGALNYNENKVKAGSAVCLKASMFGLPQSELSYQDKLGRFREIMRLNERSKTNVVHISLNFSEKDRLDETTLVKIADTYMNAIGFGRQPYLVYQHFDSAHPHLHILSTSIRDDGKRIPLHNLGRIQSETARKEIEESFGLVKAEGRQYVPEFLPDLQTLRKASYGKDETRKAISQVVSNITRLYKYTSIHELNAVLAQYNVLADRGKEGTRMFERGGLVYSLLDEKGNRVGVPVKASRLYGSPTLKSLEKKFRLNAALRGPLKPVVQDKIDRIFSANPSPTLKDFVKALEDAHIITILRKSQDGKIYGITFVDQDHRVVFNGSALGKEFGAKAILARIKDREAEHSLIQSFPARSAKGSHREESVGYQIGTEVAKAIKNVMTPDEQWHNVDPVLLKRRKRKRKGKSI